MESIGDKIKRLRKSKGLSLMDLANMLNVSDTAISKIETGKTKNPSIDIAFKIAKALGEDIYSLFGDVTLKNESSRFSEKDIDRLKVLVFHSLDKYESNQVFLKQFEHDQENPEDWKKFDEYRLYLSEFKKGILEKLIEVRFCTQEDIKEYRAYLYKQANERKFAKNTEVKNEEDPEVRELLDEIVRKEHEHVQNQLQEGTKYENLTTLDGRPFIQDIRVSGDTNIVNLTHPDNDLFLNKSNELDQILPDINAGKTQIKGQ